MGDEGDQTWRVLSRFLAWVTAWRGLQPCTARETIAGREVGLQKPIEPEPTSDKPLNIIRENSAKQLCQEHSVVSVLSL